MRKKIVLTALMASVLAAPALAAGEAPTGPAQNEQQPNSVAPKGASMLMPSSQKLQAWGSARANAGTTTLTSGAPVSGHETR